MGANSIWQVLWRLILYAKRLYCIDTLLWLGIVGLPIVPGVLIQQFFNSLTQHTDRNSAWVWVALLIAVGVARVVAIFIGRMTKTQHRFLMSGLVRHNLLLALLNQPGAALATGQKPSIGEILNYFRDDASQIEDTVASTNEIFSEAVFAIVSVVLLLSVNARMTVFVFAPLCAIALLVHRAEHRIKRYRRASREAAAQVTGLITETFSAVQSIKVAGAEATMLRELKIRGDRRQKLTVRDRLFTAILDAGFESIVGLGTALILLLAAQNLQPLNNQSGLSGGLSDGLSGSLSVGDFALFVYYLSFITYFFAFAGSFLAVAQQSEVSFERMAALIENSHACPRESAEPSKEITAHHPLYLNSFTGNAPPLPLLTQLTTADLFQELRAENLCYRYPGSRYGIQNISFTLKRGTLTVITGSVGAGKTTLLRVLLGLLPMQSGSLYWNDQIICDPANFLIPPRAAYTPQVPQLFSTSLRNNLQLGLSGSHLETRLTNAVTTAVFDQDIVAMPAGLETSIGSQGLRLSGGQKQRVAAARMLLRSPQLLVFDDLSSALDIQTEAQLWNNLLAAREDGTMSTYLAVSHRPYVLNRADQIIVLDAGRMRHHTEAT